jgi:hypothetical protein
MEHSSIFLLTPFNTAFSGFFVFEICRDVLLGLVSGRAERGEGIGCIEYFLGAGLLASGNLVFAGSRDARNGGWLPDPLNV